MPGNIRFGYKAIQAMLQKFWPMINRLGRNKAKQFMNSCLLLFMSRGLPEMLSGMRGKQLRDAQSSLMQFFNLADPKFYVPNFEIVEDRPVIRDIDRRDWSAPIVGEGPLEWGPNGSSGEPSGGPVGKWRGGYPDIKNGPGPIVSRTFGWGGSPKGGWSVDDMLNQIFDDPISYWQKLVSSQTASKENPFAEEASYRDFLREQRRKDQEFSQELDKDKQKYVDWKMSTYYDKSKSQWAKEKLFEGAGRAAQALGDIYNIYNSTLANAIMQSAASRVSPAQEQLYGNPYKSGAALYAGGKTALGGAAGAIGEQLGNFLKDWSNDLRAEFENQRIMRLQLDNRQPGQVIDTIGRMRKREAETRRK